MTALRLVVACGGAELHWVGASAGDSLQGWYKSKTQARKAHAALVAGGLAETALVVA